MDLIFFFLLLLNKVSFWLAYLTNPNINLCLVGEDDVMVAADAEKPVEVDKGQNHSWDNPLL